MNTYPISSPPHSAGVYILRNRLKNKYYVGESVDLRRRWGEWKAAFAHKIGVKSKVVLSVVNDTQPDEWEFVVVQELPGADTLTRKAAEQQIIDELKRQGHMPLNGELYTPRVKGVGATALSIVLNDAGEPVPYMEAARLIGRSLETLRKRLRNLRSLGKNKVTIKELKQP